MKRDIDIALKNWKNSKIRQPLLLRGARQVGKTYSVKQFGKNNFGNFVVVNFEENSDFIQCFDNFNPQTIIEKISILTNQDIIPGKTLLFLDEIQDCPQAISSLRYFYENMPDLHVIGAGSLVEFALKSENFRMPVGRIQSIFMHPLSFSEFLNALNHTKLNEYLCSVTVAEGIAPAITQKLEELLKLYFLIGGMPKPVDAYCKKISLNEIMILQNNLIRSYEDDFAKYASTAQHKYLKEVWLSAPAMVGKRYKYSNVNSDIQSKYLKEALNLLCDAFCIINVPHSAGNGVPLASEVNPKKFKILLLDIGLMQRALRLDHTILLKNEILQINMGSVAEQFVGQELIASDYNEGKGNLFFWVRDAKSSNAEIDFLINIKNTVFPVEVKAGTTGTLKSLRLFLDEHSQSNIGIRFSMQELSFHDNILSVPLFMVNQLERLLGEL